VSAQMASGYSSFRRSLVTRARPAALRGFPIAYPVLTPTADPTT
jgi:hypothetical protein